MADRNHSILMIESQPAATLGLKAIISSRKTFEIKGICRNEAEALAWLEKHHLEVGLVLTAYMFPDDGDGIDFAQRASERWPDLEIVLLTAFEDPSVARKALRNGVIGVVGRNDRHTVLLAALDAAAQHQRFVSQSFQDGNDLVGGPLTERQRAVLEMMADGIRTAEIAANLGLGEETVRTHIKAAIRKLGATDRTQAVAIALRLGLID